MVNFTKRIATLAIVIATLGASPAVFAHAHLKTQYPAADKEVTTAPKVLTLDFSEGIEPKFSGIKLTGPADAIIQTGKVERNAQNEKQMIVPLESALQPGAYTVEWHVVSVDGHKTQGNYHFTVK